MSRVILPAFGVPPSYRDALWSFAKSQYSTLRADFFTDLLNTVSGTDFATSVTGSGSVALTTSNGTGGVYSAGTTSSVGTAKVVPIGNAAASGGFMNNPKTSVWFGASRLNFSTTADAATSMLFGFENPGSAGVAYFGVDGSTSITKLITAIGAGANVQSTTNIPVPGFQTLAIGSDATTVSFWMGDPQAGTMTLVTTGLASGLPAGTVPNVPLVRMGANGTAQAVLVDNLYAAWA